MSRIVRVNAGVKQITLPNGRTYDGQTDVTLTDDEYAQIRAALFPDTLTDLGHVADPGIDADFVTTAEQTAALSTKQDAATAATDAEVAALFAVEAGKEIASVSYGAAFTPPSSAIADVPGLSVLVPANSGPANIALVGGALVSIVTGTIVSTSSQRLSLYLADEANVVLGYGQWIVYGTGVSQSLGNVMALGASVLNNAVDKTYKVQIAVQRQGTSGASGSIAAGGAFPNLFLQAIRR